MPQRIHEQATLAEAAAGGSVESGRFPIQVITPGQGSSGYYTPAVCEAAASLVQRGTPMYLDHPRESDQFERPERSLRDLAAVFTEAGHWDPERQAVIAEAQVFAPYREVITEMAPYIGVSVLADGKIVEGALPGGGRGKVVESIDRIQSVDFVTKAGRGGKVLALLESARITESANVGQHMESRIHQHFTNQADNMAADGRLTREERITLSGAIGDALDAFHQRVQADAPHLFQRDPMHPAPTATPAAAAAASMSEAATNDTREALDQAIKDAYGADKVWVGVRDFDPDTSTVWFNQCAPDSDALYQLGYTVADNGDISLTGTPVEVRTVTTYVPVNPAGQPTTQESEEDTMPNIEESELARLREADGRVQTLESERDTAVRERDEVRHQLAESQARETARGRARTRITEANAALPAATVDRIVEAATRTVPLTEAGALDEAAFDTAVEAARTAEETYLATLAEASGAGRVTGLGLVPVKEGEVTRKDTAVVIAEAFGRQPKTAKEA